MRRVLAWAAPVVAVGRAGAAQRTQLTLLRAGVAVADRGIGQGWGWGCRSIVVAIDRGKRSRTASRVALQATHRQLALQRVDRRAEAGVAAEAQCSIPVRGLPRLASGREASGTRGVCRTLSPDSTHCGDRAPWTPARADRDGGSVGSAASVQIAAPASAGLDGSGALRAARGAATAADGQRERGDISQHASCVWVGAARLRQASAA